MGVKQSKRREQGVALGITNPSFQLPLEAGVGFRLSRLVRILKKNWSEELIDVGVTPPQAAILRAVGLQPESSVRHIARTLDSDPMNVKRCVDELEAKGLIESGSREGGRTSRRLSLTESGVNLVVKIDALARAQQKWIEEGLGAELLSKLLQSIEGLESLFSKASEANTTVSDGDL